MGNGGCPPTGPRTVPPPPHHPPAPHTGSRPRREDRGGVLDGSSRGGRGGGAVMRGSGCRGRSGGVREGTAGGVGSASPSASVWEGGNTGEAGGGLGEGCWWGGWVRGGVGRSSIMSTERPGRGGQLTHRRGAEGGGRGQQPQRHRAVWPPGRAPPGCRAAQVAAVKVSGFGAAPARCGPGGTPSAERAVGRRQPHLGSASIGDRPRLACTGVGPRVSQRGGGSLLRRVCSAARDAGGGRRCLGRQYSTGGQTPAAGT